MMKRRQFVQYAASSTALLGTIGLPAFSTNSEARAVPIRKSLKLGMVKEELSLLDKFKLLKDLGFDGVEPESPNALDKKEVLEACDKTGLLIPGVVNSEHWKSPLSHPDAAVRARCVQSMKQALVDCKDYGGNTVLLVAGVVNDEISYEQAYRRTQEEIKKMLPLAHELGVRIAIENVWNNFLLSPMEAARYIDEFEDPMIGWYFDVGNVVRFGWPEHWIATLGPRILKLDVKEYSRTRQKEEGLWAGFDVPLLEGDCNWPSVMRALRAINYSGGWMSAEVPGGDRARLLDISQRMDRIIAS
jgi:hexulose-6-phosphate isomerase